MGHKTLFFGLSCILFAHYIYMPIPENIEERWKVRMIDAVMKISSLLATFFENMGLMKFEDIFFILMSIQNTEPVSDENITVIDTDFSDIPVRLYLPKRKSERQRPAVIYIHGGAFVTGSFKMLPYDSINRFTANKLDAVVVAPDYRLAPKYSFPAALEDCVLVIKFFLQNKVLEKYGVNPSRICISGDSSGGNLVAAVTQQLQDDPEYKNKIKAQILLYPGLQAIDTLMPSYRECEHGPFLSRKVAIKVTYLYVAEDEELANAILRNEHMPEGSRHLFKFVNWSDLLPEKYKKNHVYTEPVLGKLNDSYPALVDSRASPLLVSDSQLQILPLTYILTCEHDILRDDGLIYVTRLRNAGVPVTHDHIEDGIHGALSLVTSPFYLHLGLRIRDKYLSWLEENL
ncbi:arylacetamide deacetylase-like 2 [Peromyscus californicus insignis]|uniref:arylacetamide deacetylase-like 2 n=1 Tax=Peromyscus californicus insignis TaxID=564181 RepID=UPI0022A72711|nr:arylacetamide deacetylase-like 2 [Peromyscus californicus insignis]